jgi:hypothetical protein
VFERYKPFELIGIISSSEPVPEQAGVVPEQVEAVKTEEESNKENVSTGNVADGNTEQKKVKKKRRKKKGNLKGIMAGMNFGFLGKQGAGVGGKNKAPNLSGFVLLEDSGSFDNLKHMTLDRAKMQRLKKKQKKKGSKYGSLKPFNPSDTGW